MSGRRFASELWRHVAALSVLSCGCGATELGRTDAGGAVAERTPPRADRGVAPEMTAAPVAENTPPADPLLAVTDRELLVELEQRGFALGPLVFAMPQAATAKDLMEHRGYRDLVATLSRDLSELRRHDPRLGEGMAHAHRLFPAGWLGSEHFRFELVGVVNRIDRKVFAEQTCGELRLVYRLRYSAEVSGQTVASRVPMTVNVVGWLPDGDCGAWARRWSVAPDASGPSAALLAETGPLGAEALKAVRLKSIEVNLQSVRWPSTVRPSMAGHAEYLLRVFHPTAPRALGHAHADDDPGGRDFGLLPAGLENTPDVAALRASRVLRDELLEWLERRETLRAIDAGTALLPERFLAKRAVSVAPHGLARRANRPFAQVFEPAELAKLPLEGHTTFRTPQALLRRLDGLSCMGCHQSRSVAGFHLLGEDDAGRRADVLAVPHSAHFADELLRRASYQRALLAGESPDERRPPAERADGRGGYGEACTLEPSGDLVAWGCSEGLRCVRTADPDVGQCLPERPGAGDACELGHMRVDPNPHRDALRLEPPSGCGPGAVCERSAVGFPGGMCSSGCGALGDEAVCGAIAVLSGFNACLARREPFDACILGHSRPGALRRCSADAPCRDDYVCARMPDGESACLPPYFLFQLRVDGHVLP